MNISIWQAMWIFWRKGGSIYQWFFVVGTLCWGIRHSKPEKRFNDCGFAIFFIPSFTASEATFEVCATTGLDLVPIITVCTPDVVVSLASWATKNIYILQSTLTNTNQWGRLLQKTPDHLHLVSLLRLLHVALLHQNLHVDLDRRSP